eukprot:Hpha_TRINITY_DN10151_c0_g2::TRINITY_DN10151_c0_g2_i1::g.131596::m.131596
MGEKRLVRAVAAKVPYLFLRHSAGRSAVEEASEFAVLHAEGDDVWLHAASEDGLESGTALLRHAAAELSVLPVAPPPRVGWRALRHAQCAAGSGSVLEVDNEGRVWAVLRDASQAERLRSALQQSPVFGEVVPSASPTLRRGLSATELAEALRHRAALLSPPELGEALVCWAVSGAVLSSCSLLLLADSLASCPLPLAPDRIAAASRGLRGHLDSFGTRAVLRGVLAQLEVCREPIPQRDLVLAVVGLRRQISAEGAAVLDRLARCAEPEQLRWDAGAVLCSSAVLLLHAGRLGEEGRVAETVDSVASHLENALRGGASPGGPGEVLQVLRAVSRLPWLRPGLPRVVVSLREAAARCSGGLTVAQLAEGLQYTQALPVLPEAQPALDALAHLAVPPETLLSPHDLPPLLGALRRQDDCSAARNLVGAIARLVRNGEEPVAAQAVGSSLFSV